MKKGDQVTTPYGKIETVMKEECCQVITYESARENNWWHPSKLITISLRKKK
jgi:hypothetical protein